MKRWFGILQGILSVAVLVVAAGVPRAVAQSSDLQPVLDRMERLERDIRTLNLRLARGGSAPTSAASGGAVTTSDDVAHIFSRLDVRLTSLEEELRATTGRVEDLTFKVNQLNERLDKLVGDVDYRLTTLERSQGAAPGAPPPQPPKLSAVPIPPAVQTVRPGGVGPSFATPPGSLGTITGKDMQAYGPPGAALQPAAPTTPAAPPPAAAATEPKVLPDGTAKEQYAYAFGLLRQANYDKAEEALQAFLARHGDDPLAGNARYWLGETYYVRGEYVQAAEVFLKGYQSDPKSPKAPDTLLKLGMSLTSLDKKREACAAFDKLEADFPNASASIKNTMAKERKRGACR